MGGTRSRRWSRPVTALIAIAAMMVGGVFAGGDAFAAIPCHPDVPQWPNCLPTDDEVRSATRTEPNRAVFWTAQALNEAGQIADQFGGTTLEQALERADLSMPGLTDRRSPEGDAAWELASRSLARQASGIALLVIGDRPRPGNVWETIEFPTIRENRNVDCVIQIIARTGDEQVIYTRPGITPEECRERRAMQHARLACPDWERAGWPRAREGEHRQAEYTHEPTFRQGEVLYGGEARTTVTRENIYSVMPSPTRSPAEAQRHLHATPVIGAHFQPGIPNPLYFFLYMDADQANANRRIEPAEIGCKPGIRDEHKKRRLDEAKVRVMPLGASFTQGVKSSDGNGYREKLQDRLRDAGVDKADLDFVGSLQHGDMDDPDHEGHSGNRIKEIADKASCPVRRYRPNVVTLVAGTNDMVQNRLAGAADRLGQLIDQVLRDAPDATVLVGNLPPNTDPADPGINQRTTTYNSQVPGVVAARANAGKHVRFVDLGAVTAADISDDHIHPGDRGYEKFAEAFFDAIAEAVTAGWITDPVAQVDAPTGCPEDSDNADDRWPDKGVVTIEHGGDKRYWFADVTGDGRDDRLVVDGTGDVTAFRNAGWPAGGKLTWAEMGKIWERPGVGNQVRFADIDGDRRADCIRVNSSGGITAFTYGDGAPCQREVAGGAGIPARTIDPDTQIRFMDVDGDRFDDYVLSPPGGGTSVLLNNGRRTGHPWAWKPMANSLQLPQAADARDTYADIDGNGLGDYLRVYKDGAVDAWLARGSEDTAGRGQVWRSIGRIVKGFGVPGKDVQFADLDGDRRADYLRVGHTGITHAWLNRTGHKNGPFIPKARGFTDIGVITIEHGADKTYRWADINGDRRDDRIVVDVAGANEGQVHGWRNTVRAGTAKPAWDARPRILRPATAGAVGNQWRFGDLDGDGNDDCIRVELSGAMKVYSWDKNTAEACGSEMRVNGGSVEPVELPGGSVPATTKIRFADLNADGFDDYVTIAADGVVRVWLNWSSDGFKGGIGWLRVNDAPPDFTAAAPASQIEFADVDGDRRDDILIVGGNGSAEAWLNKPGGAGWNWQRFDLIASGLRGVPGKDVQFADINGDRKADYLRVGHTGITHAWINNN
jgi:lysophospholipase L1-like esterase